jgi:hypothetical protein
MKRLAGWVAAAGLVLPLMLAAPTANAAGTADRWTVQYETAKGASEEFAALALGRKDVWAFGNTTTGVSALHWSGGRWKTVRLPHGFWATDAAASNATDIWLAGYTSTRGEILRYTGHSWASVPVPPPAHGFPSDMAVINAHDVWAASGYNDCSGLCTVLLHWNGRTWSDVAVHAGAAQIGASPTGQLWAVGSSKVNRYEQPIGRVLAYIWTGKSWRYVTGIPDHGKLATCCGFTVTASNDVWIENAHWNGRHWSTVRIPAGLPAGAPMLSDGSGGVWFGAWARLTSRDRWTNTLLPPYTPRWLGPGGVGIYSLARIPGTTTIIGTGTTGIGSGVRAIIMAFGKMP